MAQKNNLPSSLSLRFAQRSDIHDLHRWSIQSDFLHYFGQLKPAGVLKQKQELARRVALNSIGITTRQTLIITDGSQHIGYVTVANIDWRNKNCVLELYIDKKFRNTSLAISGGACAFGYLFDELNMHKVYVYILDTNKELIDLQTQLNQKPEIIFHKHIMLGASFHDMYVYGFFRDSFQKIPSALKETFLSHLLHAERTAFHVGKLLVAAGCMQPGDITSNITGSHLESIIKNFQTTQHLQPTGVCDNPTLERLIDTLYERLNCPTA